MTDYKATLRNYLSLCLGIWVIAFCIHFFIMMVSFNVLTLLTQISLLGTVSYFIYLLRTEKPYSPQSKNNMQKKRSIQKLSPRLRIKLILGFGVATFLILLLSPYWSMLKVTILVILAFILLYFASLIYLDVANKPSEGDQKINHPKEMIIDENKIIQVHTKEQYIQYLDKLGAVCTLHVALKLTITDYTAPFVKVYHAPEEDDTAVLFATIDWVKEMSNSKRREKGEPAS